MEILTVVYCIIFGELQWIQWDFTLSGNSDHYNMVSSHTFNNYKFRLNYLEFYFKYKLNF